MEHQNHQVVRADPNKWSVTLSLPSSRVIPYFFNAIAGLTFMGSLYLFAMKERQPQSNEGFLKMVCFPQRKFEPIPAKFIGISPTPEVAPKNECAPVWSSQLGNEPQRTFIDRFAKVAITEMEKYGVPASISLAQGLIESRAGTSRLAVQANNFFGIKCMSKRCRKGHCINATDDSHKDFFRKFQSPWFSWREHSVLISSGRYARLKKNGRDYRKWAIGLKSLGYATDPSYAQKLIQTIEQLGLQQYDRP